MIMAHAGAQHIVDRHMPIWLAEPDTDVVLTAPRDSMVQSQWPVVAIGYASHHSPLAIQRFREILRFMSRMRYENYRLHEYDSLCIGPPTVAAYDSLYSNLFFADQPQFKGHSFTHPPLTMGAVTIQRLVEAFDRVGDDVEKCFWDRAVGYLCEENNIPLKGYDARGFSRNTIEQGDIAAAVSAARAGAVMFHGVKSDAVLKAIRA
jgi:hypothetical protein